MAQTPPWKRKNPKRTSTKLSPADVAAARARARRAGRRYPNLVDNMWAATRKTAKKKPAAAKKKPAAAKKKKPAAAAKKRKAKPA